MKELQTNIPVIENKIVHKNKLANSKKIKSHSINRTPKYQ